MTTCLSLSRRSLIGAALGVGLLAPALAQENGSRDEAKTMVDAAVEHAKKVGPEQAFKDFTDKANATWHKKDLYVFAYTIEGVNVGHGANDKLVGKNLIELKDPNGKPLIQELRDAAKRGGGWVEYDWPHPQTKSGGGRVRQVPQQRPRCA